MTNAAMSRRPTARQATADQTTAHRTTARAAAGGALPRQSRGGTGSALPRQGTGTPPRKAAARPTTWRISSSTAPCI